MFFSVALSTKPTPPPIQLKGFPRWTQIPPLSEFKCAPPPCCFQRCRWPLVIVTPSAGLGGRPRAAAAAASEAFSIVFWYSFCCFCSSRRHTCSRSGSFSRSRRCFRSSRCRFDQNYSSFLSRAGQKCSNGWCVPCESKRQRTRAAVVILLRQANIENRVDLSISVIRRAFRCSS